MEKQGRRKSLRFQPLSCEHDIAETDPDGTVLHFGGGYIREDYVKARQLRGVSLSSKGSVFVKQEEWGGKEGAGVSELRENCNQLCKSHLREEDAILRILAEYADKKPWHCWISVTFPADLNLPLRNTLACRIVQVFFVGVGRPVFVLSLHGSEEDASQIERYTVETVRQLSWRLLDFCRVDFIVLPCTLTNAKFSLDNLKKEVCTQQAFAEEYFRGPMVLTSDSFLKIKAAATAQAGASVVPCLLTNPEIKKTWLLLMDKQWRKALSQVIEATSGEDCMRDRILFYQHNEEFKVKATAIEVAKRLSARELVLIASSDKSVVECSKRIKDKENTKQPQLKVVESDDDAKSGKVVDNCLVIYVDWNLNTQPESPDTNAVLENATGIDPRLKLTINQDNVSDENNHDDIVNKRLVFELTELVKQSQWESVDEELGKCLDVERVRVVIEVGKHISDNELVMLLLNLCSPTQIELLLPDLVNGYSWAAVDAVLRKGVSETLHRWAIKQAVKLAQREDLVRFILPNCSGDDVINYVLTVCSNEQVPIIMKELVERGLWRAVGVMLEKQIGREQHEWLVKKAIRQADNFDLISFILPNCSHEHLTSMLKDLAERDMWQTIAKVLQCPASEEKQFWTSAGSFKRAIENNIISNILPFCKQEVNLILPALVKKRFWRAVAVSLQSVERASTLYKWAIKEALQHAEAKHLHAILPFCLEEELDPVLSQLVVRGCWQDVLTILKRGRKLSDRARNWAVEKASRECKESELMVEIIGFCQKDVLVKLAKGLIGDDLWPIVCDLFRHHAADDVVKSKSRISDPKHSGVDRDVHAFLALKSKAIGHSESSHEHSLKIPLLMHLPHTTRLKHSTLPGHAPKRLRPIETFPDEKHLVKSSCVLQGLSANPHFPLLQKASIKQLVTEGKWDSISALSSSIMPENTRRWLFEEAVQSKEWTTVLAFGDQNLYDDQRSSAINKAAECGRWAEALLLADHGLNMVERARLHQRIVKDAPFCVVRRMFELGGDITEVSLYLQNNTAYDLSRSSREKRLKKLQKLETEIRTKGEHNIGASIVTAARNKQWGQVLFWIQEKPGMRSLKRFVIKTAVRKHAWRVVMRLVNIGINLTVRDSLFLDMLRRGQFGVCRALLEHRVSTRLCMEALHTLLEQKQWVLVARVMEYNTGDDKRRLVIKQAMEEGEGSLVWHCITTMEKRLSLKEREQLFNQAVDAYNWQAVKAFVGEKDSLGFSHRETAIIEAIAHKQWDVVDYCMHQNADLDDVAEVADACVFAAMCHDWDTVEQLVQRGVSSSLFNSARESLLHLAIDAEAWSAVKFLIEFQADIHQADRDGHTPLGMLIDACQSEAITLALLWCPDLSKGINENGETTLHAVCLAGCWETMYYLVARGVNPLAVTKDGESVLMYAVKNKGNPQRMVAECIKLGFSTHQPFMSDTDTITPFEFSLHNNMPAITNMLYESGSCSNSELFRLYEYYGTHIMAGIKLHTNCLPYLASVATNPRSLSSLCRIVISHSLSVRRKRRRDIENLPLSRAAKNYVMFSDLTDHQYCLGYEVQL